MSAEIRVGITSLHIGTITEIRPLGEIPHNCVLPVPGSSDEFIVNCTNPDATLVQRVHSDGRPPEPARIVNDQKENVVFGELANGNRRLLIVNHKQKIY